MPQRQILVRLASISASVGLRVLLQERHRRHDLPGLAVAALRHVLGEPGLLHGMPAVGRQAFDGGDRLVDDIADLDAARADGLAVHVHGAGAALCDAAAEFRAGHAELVADDPKKRGFRLDIQRIRLTIYGKCNHGALALLCTTGNSSASGLKIDGRLTPRMAASIHRCVLVKFFMRF